MTFNITKTGSGMLELRVYLGGKPKRFTCSNMEEIIAILRKMGAEQ